MLYVNGDSHTAAAEAAVAHGWACDDGDPAIQIFGKRPHPENDRVSFGYRLSQDLGCAYINDSQSGGSNTRILRTTNQFLDNYAGRESELFVLIQWSTWEREEWLIDGEYYQINASGNDTVPESHQQEYKQWIINIDWQKKSEEWHQKIWQYHQNLVRRQVRHLFFNADMYFPPEEIPLDHRHDWNRSYLDPYSESGTYQKILKHHGFRCQSPHNYHFGVDGHCFWSKYLLQYIIDNNLIEPYAIRTD